MISMEQVEKLRQYGNISFEDAKRALEQTDGNLLDAVILLEKEGLIASPGSGGRTETEPPHQDNTRHEHRQGERQESFGTYFMNFLKWCGKIIHRGNINTFDVTRRGELIISMPVTILIILTVCFFWLIGWLLVIGLFFDFRYSFRGPHLGDSVNNIVNSVADAADGIKNSVKDAVNENKDGENSDN